MFFKCTSHGELESRAGQLANSTISFFLEPEQEGSKSAKPYLKSSDGAVQGKRENLTLQERNLSSFKKYKRLHYVIFIVMILKGSVDVCNCNNQQSNGDGCSMEPRAGRFIILCTSVGICFLFQSVHGQIYFPVSGSGGRVRALAHTCHRAQIGNVSYDLHGSRITILGWALWRFGNESMQERFFSSTTLSPVAWT